MTYGTIVADPPWSYRTTTPMAGSIKAAAASQYPVMTLDAIAALPVAGMASGDAHLYLWVTNPLLREGFEIVDAWGFRYVTTLGLGYYFRGNTEHVLFGIRGRAPIAPARREANHFAAAKSRHSAKPDRFYELVERVSPGPYLELFARRRRYGWDVWGNEAPEFAASQAEMGLSA